jgi:plasmid stabilization system protein ParE
MFEVFLTPSAKADIFETNTWLLENFPEYSGLWLMQTSEALMSLKNFPERCPISRENDAFDIIVRELLFGKKPNIYRVFFSIVEENVFVLRIRSTKMNWISEESQSNE